MFRCVLLEFFWKHLGITVRAYTLEWGACTCEFLLCFAWVCFFFAPLCLVLCCFASLCFALLCFALPCLALPCFALPCFALLSFAVFVRVLFGGLGERSMPPPLLPLLYQVGTGMIPSLVLVPCIAGRKETQNKSSHKFITFIHRLLVHHGCSYSNSINGHSFLHRTVPYHTIPYRIIQYRTVPYTKPHIFHTVPYITIPYHIVPYHSVPHRTVPCHRTVPRTYNTCLLYTSDAADE